VAANKVTLLVEHVGIIGLHISRSQVDLWSRSFLIALFIYIYIYIYGCTHIRFSWKQVPTGARETTRQEKLARYMLPIFQS
jgi:hypothetical protein